MLICKLGKITYSGNIYNSAASLEQNPVAMLPLLLLCENSIINSGENKPSYVTQLE